MAYVASAAYAKEFVTSSPTTGAAANADSLPTATANLNGTDDGTFSLTVANIDTGRYKVTGTIPAGYVAGDVLNVSIAATVGGIAAKAVIDTQIMGPELSQADVRSAIGLTSANMDSQLADLPTSSELTTALASADDAILATLSTFNDLGEADIRTALGLSTANLDSQLTPLTNLDVAVSTRAVSGNSMTLTVGERNAIADAFLARSLGTETYAAQGAVPTIGEALFMLLSSLTQFDVISTTITTKKLDGSTAAMTFTLDDATTPTSRVRVA